MEIKRNYETHLWIGHDLNDWGGGSPAEVLIGGGGLLGETIFERRLSSLAALTQYSSVSSVITHVPRVILVLSDGRAAQSRTRLQRKSVQCSFAVVLKLRLQVPYTPPSPRPRPLQSKTQEETHGNSLSPLLSPSFPILCAKVSPPGR